MSEKRPHEKQRGGQQADSRAGSTATDFSNCPAGFGEAYQANRTGEGEYIAYRPDKSFQTPPQGTGACAACHTASNKDRDFTFRAWFTMAGWAQAPLPPRTR